MAVAVAEAKQGKTNSTVTSLATTPAFTTPPSVGDAILVFYVTAVTPTSTHTAPTDSAGHTATQIGSEQSDTTQGGQISAWIFENLTAGTGLSSYVVTAHWGSGSGSVIALRVTGQLTPTSYNGDIVQSSLTTSTSSTNPSVGPTTVTPAANSVFFGAVANINASTDNVYTDGTNIAWTHITNETQPINSTADALFVEHFIETGGSTTKQTAQWTGVTQHWLAMVFSLAPASGAVVFVPRNTYQAPILTQ